jgi:hypothetical protein
VTVAAHTPSSGLQGYGQDGEQPGAQGAQQQPATCTTAQHMACTAQHSTEAWRNRGRRWHSAALARPPPTCHPRACGVVGAFF